jgi:hypothetical protein
MESNCRSDPAETRQITGAPHRSSVILAAESGVGVSGDWKFESGFRQD